MHECMPEESFLIVGLGSIGQRHLRNLRALGMENISVLRSRKGMVPQDLPLDNVKIFDRIEEALDNGPNAAVICNPTSLHIPTALALASSGCHLMIEKPLSHSMEGISELEELAAARGLIVTVAYQMRFHPGVRLMRDLVNEGAIGKVLSARAEVGQYLPDWHPYEDYRQGYSARSSLGGGVILDLIHEIDYMCWLFGPPRRVFCMSGTHSSLEIETEDVAEILLECAGAPIVGIHMDYVQRKPSRTCTIIGENGTIHWDYHLNTVSVYTAETAQTKKYCHEGFERNQMYCDELKHFIRCLHGEEKPLAGLADARKSLEVALMAKQSSRDRKEYTFS